MNRITHSVPFLNLLEEFLGFYKNDFGGQEFLKNYTKANESKKIQKLLLTAKRDRVRLGTDDYLITIHSSSSFTFAKAETIFFVSVIMLAKWEDEIGIPNGISDDVYMNNMFFRLLSKCDKYKAHISANPNFSERFLNRLSLLAD